MRELVVSLLLVAISSICFAGLAEGEVAFRKGEYSTAFKEYWPFAEQGHAEAQKNLGIMYFEGKGVVERLPTSIYLV
jgi:TPR repeat protein